MLKVKGSNPGASILKFGLFQFSKWLHFDKSNNLGILVVFASFRWLNWPRAIQSSFMVYKWTMAMQFSFEYCIDLKDQKSEVEYK